MKNVHILPTNEPSKIGYHFDIVPDGSLDYAPNFGFKEFNIENNFQHRPHFVYITSDEEIKKGNFICDGVEIFTAVQDLSTRGEWKKIILTTDTTLIAGGVQAIDDTFLEWFVKNPTCEFVKVSTYMKKIGVETDANSWREMDVFGKDYRITIPQEEPKQENNLDKHLESIPEYKGTRRSTIITKKETLEEAAGEYANKELNAEFSKVGNFHAFSSSFKKGAEWQAERTYSEEEVLQLLHNYRNYFELYRNIQVLPNEFFEWFEQFKKK